MSNSIEVKPKEVVGSIVAHEFMAIPLTKIGNVLLKGRSSTLGVSR
jgi:hypothetical protein